MKGNVPSGAKRLVSLGDVTGGWKAYAFGGDMEWLFNVTIDVGQSDVNVTLDWYYARAGSKGDGFVDDTPDSKFSGTFDGGMLDATGSGRLTLVAFWQQDGKQYAVGSLILQDGTTCTVALVRP